MVGFCILDLTSEQDFLFPKGGGGWRKTFKTSFKNYQLPSGK
jgi:hypothetical protein